MGAKWSDQDDALLSDYAARRLSFQDAADALGRSRNAVAGRAHRLGVAFTAQSSPATCAKVSAAAFRRWRDWSPERRAEVAAAISAGHRRRFALEAG